MLVIWDWLPLTNMKVPSLLECMHREQRRMQVMVLAQRQLWSGMQQEGRE